MGQRGRVAGFCLSLLLLVQCAGPKPILIGFASELTGKRGELGMASRDGTQLAIDEINSTGGINGQRLELLIRDDLGAPETARQVDAGLVEKGVVAVIGHATSGQTAAVFEQLNQAGVIFLSPTSTSTDFSRQNDYFFRMVPDTDLLGQTLARQMINEGLHKVIGIYEWQNRSYAGRLWAAAQAEFEQLGGETAGVYTYTSGVDDVSGLIARVPVHSAEAMVMVSPAVDTALMVQYVRQENETVRFFSVPWSQTPELLQKGGRAVEGLELVVLYNPQSTYPPFVKFFSEFKERYGYDPDFAAAYSYEAIWLLAEALKQNGGRAEGLREVLAQIRRIDGIQSPVILDEYGDCNRPIYIARVENSAFNIFATINPEP